VQVESPGTVDADNEGEIVADLLRTAVAVRLRILRAEGEERPDGSWQRLTCHLHREDVPFGAIPLIFAIGMQSFLDARPRGNSDIYYREKDTWTLADVVSRLRLERGGLDFDADYVRGRMMKTRITVEPGGRVVVETRNRHEMARRWLDTLKGRRHVRLVVDRRDGEPIPS